MPDFTTMSDRVGGVAGVGSHDLVGTARDGGRYVDVAGAALWHFTGGEDAGAPTVLLHGAFASASTWGAQIASFADAGLQVFVPERSGHGHSPDVDRPWSMAMMAEQIIDYLDTVVGAPAHLVGWADGAVLALLVARERPDLVARVVTVSHYLNAAGSNAAEFFTRLTARDGHLVDFLKSAYVTESPDGAAHFDEVYEKSLRLLTTEPDYPVTDFATVRAPTLIVVPDHGMTHLEHAVEMARTLPNARLAVLPGTHILPIEAPELFNPLVLSFLATDPPSRWMP